MSYCVNCGVRLNQAEKVCPLCECPVVNPLKPEELPEHQERPYPKRKDTIKNIVDRSFIISVISFLYLLPIVICIAVDFILSRAITWSLISTIGVVLCWAIIFLPYIMNWEYTLLYLSIDLGFAVALFLSIAWYTGDSDWVLTLAIPIAVTIFVILNMMVYGIKIKLIHGLYIGTFMLSAVGVLSIIVELVVWNFRRHYISPESPFVYWSVYVFISCIIIAGLLCYIEKKKAVKRGLEKTFHI